MGPPSSEITLISGCLLLSFLFCPHSHPSLRRVSICPRRCALGGRGSVGLAASLASLDVSFFVSDANKPHAPCRDEPSLSGAGACRQTLPAPPSPRTPEEVRIGGSLLGPAQATAGQAASLRWGLLTRESPRHSSWFFFSARPLSKSLGRRRPPVPLLGEEGTGQEAGSTGCWPLASRDRWTVFNKELTSPFGPNGSCLYFFLPLSFSSSLSFNPPFPPPPPSLQKNLICWTTNNTVIKL